MGNLRIPNTETLEETLNILDGCVDGYFYICSFEDNIMTISKSALKKFNLPDTTFSNFMKIYCTIVHPDDYKMFTEDIKMIVDGLKDTHNLEYRLLDKNGNTVWIRCSGRYIQLKPNTPKLFIGFINEIGNKNKADNVSGFFTELTMEDDYNNLYNTNKHPSGFFMSILIDNYHKIIEKQGTKAAEDLLKMVSTCIEDFMDKSHKCYKGASASFVIMNTNGGNEKTAVSLFNKIRAHLSYMNSKSGYKYFCIISAGVVLFPEQESVFKLLQKKLSFALEKSNQVKNNHFFIYNDSDYLAHIRQLELSKALQKSVKEGFNDFEIYYQPILDAKSLKIIGAEALLRWHTDSLGAVSPVEFIPILEETGLIIPVGKWVLNKAIEQCKTWQELYPNFKVNVNLSYIQLNYNEVIYEILSSVSESEINPCSLVLEFTESGNFMRNNTIRKFVGIFNKEDIHLALDDFGTGYSNLLHLKELKINTIKIDRNFVESACKNQYCYNLIDHIVEMAHSINITVCLEGIETEDDLKKMSVLNPDFFQGFYFSRPIPAQDFTNKFISEK